MKLKSTCKPRKGLGLFASLFSFAVIVPVIHIEFTGLKRLNCMLVHSSELNVDNWNDNCEAKSEAKSPRPLHGLQVDFSLTRNVSEQL